MNVAMCMYRQGRDFVGEDTAGRYAPVEEASSAGEDGNETHAARRDSKKVTEGR